MTSLACLLLHSDRVAKGTTLGRCGEALTPEKAHRIPHSTGSFHRPVPRLLAFEESRRSTLLLSDRTLD